MRSLAKYELQSTNLVLVEYLCSVVQVEQLQDHARHFLVVYSKTVQHTQHLTNFMIAFLFHY